VSLEVFKCWFVGLSAVEAVTTRSFQMSVILSEVNIIYVNVISRRNGRQDAMFVLPSSAESCY